MPYGERKIAVVLIHGIGDQRPMATLRSFVEALLQSKGVHDGTPLYWSKPDMLSQSFELRRYHAPAGRKHPPIDFYEYYWANKMEGSALTHTLQWINNLLLRRPRSVPPKLRNLWWVSWAILVLAGGLLAWFARSSPVGVLGALVVAITAAAKITVELALRDWVGDAARYFDDRPTNIGVREHIRRGAVELLSKIHESGDYRRVIVVGHSLGSAIALDSLYFYWNMVREKHGRPDRPEQAALFAMEKRIREPEGLSVSEFRALQKAVWKEMRAYGGVWRVTDLVTLGSPLTHLPFLTRLREAEFATRLQQRELPTSPPVMDGKGISYWTRYVTEAGASRSVATLHHAACFAATRWTNIYFEHNGWLRGDPVGGPLQHLFGAGIDDRKIQTRHWNGRLNHLDYWRDDQRDLQAPDAPLATLRTILSLDEGFGVRSSPRSAGSPTEDGAAGLSAGPSGPEV